MVSSRVFMFMHIYLFRQKENLECGGTDEYGVNAQAALHQSSSMQSVNSGVTTNSDIGDGASTTSYSRMMPAPVRLRTAAGGGVPGSMSREGIRQMKLKNASKLTR